MAAMDYKNDTRSLTIEELENILVSAYGNDNRSRGCYLNNRWISIDDILTIVSDRI